MVVADTNVIITLHLPTDFSDLALKLLRQDRDWAAPALWRSEMRNVLVRYVRVAGLAINKALEAQARAEALMHEYMVPSSDVLELAVSSGCSAYDCEFVVLARSLAIKLVTMDQKVLDAFPGLAVPLS